MLVCCWDEADFRHWQPEATGCMYPFCAFASVNGRSSMCPWAIFDQKTTDRHTVCSQDREAIGVLASNIGWVGSVRVGGGLVGCRAAGCCKVLSGVYAGVCFAFSRHDILPSIGDRSSDNSLKWDLLHNSRRNQHFEFFCAWFLSLWYSYHGLAAIHVATEANPEYAQNILVKVYIYKALWVQ